VYGRVGVEPAQQHEVGLPDIRDRLQIKAVYGASVAAAREQKTARTERSEDAAAAGVALLDPDWSLLRRALAGAVGGAWIGLLFTATKMVGQ